MKIYLCQVAAPVLPSPQNLQQCKVLEYNELLMKWTEINGVRVLQTGPCHHTLGTGDTDDLCFEKESSADFILNRLGVIRLLSSINKYIVRVSISARIGKTLLETLTLSFRVKPTTLTTSHIIK